MLTQINRLRDGFVKGVYLTGSLSLNDFHPRKSDIDFLVLCCELPDAAVQQKLESMHKDLMRRFKQCSLSGTYLTYDSLYIQNVSTAKALRWHEGQMRLGPLEMAPITLLELQATALTVYGVPAHSLPIVVHSSEVATFLHGNMNTYWKTWISKRYFLNVRQLGLLLLPRVTEWVLLGMARQLYTLQTGSITSKTGAGYYCLHVMPLAYRPIMQEAIDIRNEKSKHLLYAKPSYYIAPSPKRSMQTIDCARFLWARFNELYGTKQLSIFKQ